MVIPTVFGRRTPSTDAISRQRALVLLTACCGVFVGFGSSFVFTFGVFLKPLTLAFGWSRQQVSLGFTVAALTVAVCSPFLGRLFDRYPARRMILSCVAIYGIGVSSLSLLTPHLIHFLVVLFLLGIVGNGTTQLGYARVVSSWFDHSRGRALAAVMAGSGTGSMIFPPFTQALISAYGWRCAYAVLGGIILLLGIPLAAAFLREPRDVGRAASQPQPVHKLGLRRCITSAPFLLLISALLLFSFATNGLNAHIPALLTDRGFSPQNAASVLSVVGLAVLVSKLGTGYFLDRLFAARVATCFLVLCGIGVLLVSYSKGPAMAYAGSVLFGLGMGAESDATPYLLSRYFGLERFSELYGYTWMFYACAGALGPLAMGAFFDRTGSYTILLLIYAALVFAAAVLFVLLPNYSKSLWDHYGSQAYGSTFNGSPFQNTLQSPLTSYPSFQEGKRWPSQSKSP